MESSPSPSPSPAGATRVKAVPTLYHKLATVCWLSPLAAVAVNFVWAPLLVPVLALGAVSGLVALRGIAKHGTKGILLKVVVGLTIIAFFFISFFFALRMEAEIARNKAAEEQSEAAKQAPKK
ncbi:MAG: hypothetical protein U0984_18790 [Prosthecobacter sp.]|nr:hypothetical protein [Prosthecobacter sp.]